LQGIPKIWIVCYDGITKFGSGAGSFEGEVNMQEKKVQDDYILTLMRRELEFQQTMLVLMQEELNFMPEGTVCKKTTKGKVYYYYSIKDRNGRQLQRILKPHESELLNQLKRKHGMKKCISALKNNIPVLKEFIREYQPILALIEENEIWLMQELMVDQVELIEQWKKESFRSNSLHEKDLIHDTRFGVRVRSKSELVITGMLEANKIPYRYEAELILGEKKFYPDFTILCPRSGKLMYWEHFGMMHVNEYREKAEKKVEKYIENGLLPFDNFIATYDKADGSINAKTIQNVIDFILLS